MFLWIISPPWPFLIVFMTGLFLALKSTKIFLYECLWCAMHVQVISFFLAPFNDLTRSNGSLTVRQPPNSTEHRWNRDGTPVFSDNCVDAKMPIPFASVGMEMTSNSSGGTALLMGRRYPMFTEGWFAWRFECHTTYLRRYYLLTYNIRRSYKTFTSEVITVWSFYVPYPP